MITRGELNLESLRAMPYDEACTEIQRLPGIGPKVADCILLFAYGFPEAFPVDTWIIKALHRLYFPRRAPKPKRLQAFIKKHFAPHTATPSNICFITCARRAGCWRKPVKSRCWSTWLVHAPYAVHSARASATGFWRGLWSRS